MSEGISGLVKEARCRWEETVLILRGFGPDGGESLKKFVSGRGRQGP